MDKRTQDEGRKFFNKFYKDAGPNGIQVRSLLDRLLDKEMDGNEISNREFEEEFQKLVARYKKAGGTL